MESASHAASPRTVLLTPDPSILSGARPQRRALAAIAVVLIVLGLASFWFWIFLEYTPLWYALIVGSEHVEPMLGTSAQELQWIFCGVSIALAAVVASASELVVGLRSWAWPYQRVCRLGPIEFTWVGVSIWLLVIGSIASWALQRLIPDIKEDLDPAQAHFAAPWACVLDDLAFYAGKVSMIPISLLGVPLARSSAMWRLAGLSYEEAITYHRWLGASAVVLTTLHTLGYVIYYLQHTRTGSGLPSLYRRLFSPADGIRGLNPWCDGDDCTGVSNLAGLIAWAAGLLLATASFERVRRACYLLFIQVHQLHYLFFAFTCAHWSMATFYMIIPATFYAADIVLRAVGTYACCGATARVHGSTDDALPSMITLLLPTPAISSSGQSAAAPKAACCPYRSPSTNSITTATLTPTQATEDCPHRLSGIGLAEEDPWAGTTIYLTVRHLSPLRAMGGWTHPFTVAGSVNLHTMDGSARGADGERALLVHITPEARWTKALTKSACRTGTQAGLPGVSVTGPLPAPPHLMHLVRQVVAGHPLLLVGAGSGVTPCLALLRMLASRPLPPRARVRFVVIARFVHLFEALDGFMLPASSADRVTGMPWLTTELHLTRRLKGPSQPPVPAASSHPPPALEQTPPAVPHAFRGGFRLRPLFDSRGDGNLLFLEAVSARYAVADQDMAHQGRRVGRRFEVDEMCTLTGALLGFLMVTWSLMCYPTWDTAVWSRQPTAISGMGTLLLAWLGALLGARLALALTDCVRGRPFGAASTEQESETGDHIAPPCEPAQPAFRVTLDSNGKRPAMADCHKVFACYNKFLAAAGGPETLLEHLDASLPTQVRLLRLTHPM